MPDSPSRRAALIDNPINSHDEDFLELDGFAEALGQFIDTCDTPVTIGIQGDWGIGKTSLLNLLHHKHLKGPRRGGHPTPHIYINTWSYAQFKQEEWLGILILNGIVDELERKFPEVSTRAQAVRSVAQSIGKFALGATNQLVAKQVGINVDAGLKAASTPSASKIPQMSALLREYEEKFAVLVSAVAKGERDRLVVMIDDLDRVSPIRALELLEAIKNFLHVDRCVFVLAVDYEVIQQGVLQRSGLRPKGSTGNPISTRSSRSRSTCRRPPIGSIGTSWLSSAGIYPGRTRRSAHAGRCPSCRRRRPTRVETQSSS
jgi:Cdc6-like AAA superfamily ATPase